MDLAGYIQNSASRLAELENEISHFDFASAGNDRFQAMNREYQKLKQLQEAWDEFNSVQRQIVENKEMLSGNNDPEMAEMISADLEELQGRVTPLEQRLKMLILPSHPNEGRDVIVEIRPAAGGDEASLFAGDLYRMYMRYCETKGWHVEMLDLGETEVGGIKNVSFMVRGDEAWSLLHFESGVHRVQRVPTTETQGRIHTSTATVAVMAEAQDVDIELKPEDLRIDVFRSSGAGGQGVNRTDSAVRVTYLPTGDFVASQQERSQHKNKEIAMRILRSRLLERRQQEEDAKNAAERRSQIGSGDRSEKARTYNFPQNRVTDHRFNITRYDLPAIIDGDLDGLLGEIRAADAEQRLAQELHLDN
ncbi:MAG: peptide chain release factor 1 [Victivallales bacterium]|jgi:peptide chain release factor 1|nr:peptide chain release factor 1 [Victivallales bacterium]